MRAVLGVLSVLALPAAAQEEVVPGPSGVGYTLQETMFEPQGAYTEARRLVRLRFVAPKVADDIRYGFVVIESDFQTLCDSQAVPVVQKFAPNAREIIISVSSQALPFGESAPNVVQYFDLFRFEGNTCIWEGI